MYCRKMNYAGCVTHLCPVGTKKKRLEKKNTSNTTKNTYSRWHLSRSWGKPATREAASSAAGACGSRCRSARLSGCAAWRCWWSSRWHKSPGRPPGIRCWGRVRRRRKECEKSHSLLSKYNFNWFLLQFKSQKYFECGNLFPTLTAYLDRHPVGCAKLTPIDNNTQRAGKDFVHNFEFVSRVAGQHPILRMNSHISAFLKFD